MARFLYALISSFLSTVGIFLGLSLYSVSIVSSSLLLSARAAFSSSSTPQGFEQRDVWVFGFLWLSLFYIIYYRDWQKKEVVLIIRKEDPHAKDLI